MKNSKHLLMKGVV
jgi:hypothetical protein